MEICNIISVIIQCNTATINFQPTLFHGRLDHENLCQRGELTGMRYYYWHRLSIAVDKFIGENHFRNTREKRETNRLTLKIKTNKQTKKTKLKKDK